MAWQAFVYPRLPAVPNDPDRFGEQVVVNDQEEILRFETRLLANAAAVTLSEACRCGCPRRTGDSAHIDRPAHSLVSQLGFPPAGLKLEAVEVTRFMAANFLAAHRSWLAALPLVRFSDAHFLEDIAPSARCSRLRRQQWPRSGWRCAASRPGHRRLGRRPRPS